MALLARWALAAALCALCGGSIVACSPDADSASETPLSAGKPQGLAESPKAFRARNVSLIHRDGRQLLLRLEARELVHRSRQGRFFVYRSFDEIVIRGLRVEFPLPTTVTPNAPASLPLHEIAEALSAFGAFGENFGSTTATTAGDGDEAARLSRLAIEDAAFRWLPAGRPALDLVAARATVSGDLKVVRFEGGVRLTAARCRLAAPTALWSSEHHGLLLPLGYRGDRGRRAGRTFLSVRGNGACVKVVPIPDVGYRDLLEEHEQEFYQRISRAMPAYAQFMLGAGVVQGPEHPPPRSLLSSRHAASPR